MESAPFSQISPTALNLVWYRSRSRIPYSAQIADFTHAKEKVKDLLGEWGVSEEAMDRLGDWAELRHRALDGAIVGYNLVLEIAAGFSPRGLISAKESPRQRYVAVDLPGIFDQRISTMGLFGIPPNLYLRNADATSLPELAAAVDEFSPASLVVISEGLLSYLTHEQKRAVAQNICALLEKHSGCGWRTPDIHTKDEMARMLALSNVDMKRYDQKTGRSFMEGCFDSLDEAQELFESAGLRVQRGKQLDHIKTGELSRQSSNPAVKAMLEEQHLWWMEPR